MPPYASYYWYPGSYRGHVREYVRGDLQQMTEYLQLKVVELRGCHHMVGRVPSIARPVYKAMTAIFPGWRDSWTLVAQKAGRLGTKTRVDAGRVKQNPRHPGLSPIMISPWRRSWKNS